MDDVVQPVQTQSMGRLPIEVMVMVGRAYPSVKDLLKLVPNSILDLDCSVDDPVALFVGDRQIASGVLELSGSEEGAGQLRVRLTEILGEAPSA
jgi:flagellar motor switch protein FliN/FliY